MKTCGRCKEDKPLSDFNFKNKQNNTYQSYCRDCSKSYLKAHYENNKPYYRQKARRWNDKNRVEVRDKLRSYLLENHCVDCGESDWVVLEFDHILGDKIGWWKSLCGIV